MGVISGFSQKTMKKLLLILLLPIFYSFLPFAIANNPLTTKPENQHVAPRPVFDNNLYIKIIIWQRCLKEKMVSLIQQNKTSNSIRPLIFLFMAAFAYGVIHAAGPGHGKALALSYVFTQRPKYLQGLLFSNAMAISHGISGILFVLFIRIILNTNIVKNLENVTHITQIISYSIIACYGLGIVLNNICKLINRQNAKQKHFSRKHSMKYANPFLFALVVGSIPCPAVVMVMLFALSMDLITLGLLLGITISIGMAVTISLVVIISISGKVASFSVIAKKAAQTMLIERWVEMFAGLALMTLGILFLGANL